MHRRFFVFGLVVSPAFGHDFYDDECCSGQDCAPIPASAVQSTPNGYFVTLRPGDHLLVTAPVSKLFTYTETKRSPDGQFHACVTPSQTFLCLYAPVIGS